MVRTTPNKESWTRTQSKGRSPVQGSVIAIYGCRWCLQTEDPEATTQMLELSLAGGIIDPVIIGHHVNGTVGGHGQTFRFILHPALGRLQIRQDVAGQSLGDDREVTTLWRWGLALDGEGV